MPPTEATSDTQPAESPPPAGARQEAAGWLASLLIHAAVLLLLAAWTLPPLPLPAALSLLGEPALEEDTADTLDLDDALVDLDVETLTQPLDAPETDTPLDAPAPPLAAAEPVAALDLSSLAPTPALTAPISPSLSEIAGTGTDGRSPASRAALVAAKGGSPESEAAVQRALKWLAEHQNPDGTWSLVHTAGACRGRCANPGRVPGDDPFGASISSATGLALLPFLGAGQTQDSGRYKRVVAAGLGALARLGRVEEDYASLPGLSWRDSGRMYAHGINAIVLSEAYGLTGDRRLGAAAEAALAFVSAAQDPAGGGWRYSPQRPGDTSVTGWQIMALKSGSLAGIATPTTVVRRAEGFLDSVSAAGGSRYGYMPRGEIEGLVDAAYDGTASMTAVGLLCRMYLGWEQGDPRLAKGVEYLAQRGPSQTDYYFNYYAAQVIFHQTAGEGALWREWNDRMREQLLEQQADRGHERGSWYVDDTHNRRGGRLYTTALATMTLEVYYRYLPIYQSAAVNTGFPD
ncbi:hypothetical protein [Botrimarina sp.]|uniref:hypothetical protein n=1 Tax=Botrimarina sp. TaxID=2795802 RepID=UPI0032EFBDDA